MRLQISGNTMDGVTIPLLWGKKAILQHPDGKLSIIDLSSSSARVEILKDEPAPKVTYRPIDDGYEFQNNGVSYSYYPNERRLVSNSSALPTCIFNNQGLQIGGSFFQGNTIVGREVGIIVYEGGDVGIGAPLPPGLARLVV